jgi:hypothetical protein
MSYSHFLKIGQTFQKLFCYFDDFRFFILFFQFQLIKKSTIFTELHDNINGLIRPEAIVEFDKILTWRVAEFFRKFPHDVNLVQNDFFHLFFVFFHHLNVDDFYCYPMIIDCVISFKYLSERSFTQTALRIVFVDFVCTLFQVHDFARLHILIKIKGKLIHFLLR